MRVAREIRATSRVSPFAHERLGVSKPLADQHLPNPLTTPSRVEDKPGIIALLAGNSPQAYFFLDAVLQLPARNWRDLLFVITTEPTTEQANTNCVERDEFRRLSDRIPYDADGTRLLRKRSISVETSCDPSKAWEGHERPHATIFPRTYQNQERWLSGRKRRFAKPCRVTALPGVRIPPSPPEQSVMLDSTYDSGEPTSLFHAVFANPSLILSNLYVMVACCSGGGPRTISGRARACACSRRWGVVLAFGGTNRWKNSPTPCGCKNNLADASGKG